MNIDVLIWNCYNFFGCYPHDIGGYLLHSCDEEVVLMSDYEILIVVLTIIAIVVTLIIEYIKK